MRIARLVCLLMLFAIVSLYCSSWANAEVPQDVQQACTPDAMRLCSEFIPDVAKITACMKRKHAQISVECRTAMARGHGRGGEHRRVARSERRHEHHYYRHHHCHHCD